MSKGQVTITIDFDDSGAQKSVKLLDQGLDNLGDKGAKAAGGLGGLFDGLGLKIPKAALGFASLTGAVAGLGAAFWEATRATANYGDEIAKAAQKTGVSVKLLSEMKYAASLADVSFESLQTSLGKLAKNTLDASQGTGEAKDALAELGIQLKSSDGRLRGTSDLLLDIADKFSGMEDGTRKTALAMQIFGRAGREMIPLLNEGRDGLAAAADEAERLGIVLDEKAAKAAELFNDNLTRLDSKILGLKMSIGNDLIPILNDLMDVMFDPRWDETTKPWGSRAIPKGALGWATLGAVSTPEKEPDYGKNFVPQGPPQSMWTGTWNPGAMDAATQEALAKLADDLILARMDALMGPMAGLGEVLRIPPTGVIPQAVDIMTGTPMQGIGGSGVAPPGGTIGLPSNLPGGLAALTPDKLQPQFSAMAQLGDMFGSLTEKTGLWGDALYGVGDAMGMFASGQASLGQAFKQFAVAMISGIAKESAVKSIYNVAEGIAALTNPLTAWKAPIHFKAAAVYGAVAAAAGVAGHAMSGGSGAGGGVGSRGSAFNPISTTESSLTFDMSARSRQNAEIARLNATIASLEKRIGSMSPGDVVTVAANKGIMQYAQPRTDYRTINARVYDEPLVG